MWLGFDEWANPRILKMRTKFGDQSHHSGGGVPYWTTLDKVTCPVELRGLANPSREDEGNDSDAARMGNSIEMIKWIWAAIGG